MRSLSLLPHSGHGLILNKSSNSSPFSKEYVIVVTSREGLTEATKVWCQHGEFLGDDQLA